MDESNCLDPYRLLGVSYSATDKEIQQAFYAKMETAQDTEPLIKAYGMIRDQVSRSRFRWEALDTCLLDPFAEKSNEPINSALLAKELAFLSAWEIGDEACLN